VIVTLYEQAHLAMALHREGKWPPKENHAECRGGEVDVMRFAGRPEFISRKEKEVNTPDTHGSGSSPPNNAHPMLFEYMKQFENAADKDDSSASTYSTQTSSVAFTPEQSMLPSIVPGLDVDTNLFQSPNPDGVFSNGHSNGFDFRSSLMDQSLTPMNWPELDTMYYSGTGFTNGSQGLSNGSSLPFLPGNPYSSQGVGPFPVNGQQSQDQMWEQFVTGLVPPEALGEYTVAK
jgi:hypothetical protein